MINKIILSPPFSNIYPDIKGTTKIIGTYTKEKRFGLHRVLTTLRYKNKSFYNNVGLKNPGIDRVKSNNSRIISVSLLNKNDWFYIREVLSKNVEMLGIEFNISCPNASVQNINEYILEDAKKITKNVIIKIPHGIQYDQVKKYVDIGCNFFHVSNTQKTKYGAMSGRKLKNSNLSLIYKIKETNEKIKVIGGGGIYNIDDIKDYEMSGADYFSLSTALLNPFYVYKIINYMSQYQKLNLNHNI
tara:strand:- start:719 stop:1450 length:732 start_codon:yes stop_codon:yes gene_type:complete